MLLVSSTSGAKNKRIIDATANRMNLEESKVLMNIEKYGNTPLQLTFGA
jgi:3-oxoacyl-[acyl-carrier-protein] synthase III